MLALVPGRVLLLCYCSGQSTLCIGKLLEGSHPCCSGGRRYKRFEELKGRLVHTALRCYETQQQIEQLDSEVVGGVGYLCVTCTQQLTVFEIQLAESALSCSWLERAVTHISPSKIVCSKLR